MPRGTAGFGGMIGRGHGVPSVPRDNIPIFVQEPFVGRSVGQGEQEITSTTVGQQYYMRTEADRRRILGYLRCEALLDVRNHYEAFLALGPGITPPEEPFWIPVDFFGMISRLMRQYTFGPRFKITGQDGAPSKPEVERIFKANRLGRLMNQAAESVTALGDVVLRVDLEEVEDEEAGEARPQAVVRAVHPSNYFPELDPLDKTNVLSTTLAWVFPVDDEFKAKHGMGSTGRVVLFEVHVPGKVQYELWEWNGDETHKELPVEELFPGLKNRDTGIDEVPIVHVGAEVRAGDFWGNSTFRRIERIILALESRLSQEDEVLDKHARPKLIVGPGILDDKGRANLADFDVIEIEPSILEKAVKPEYLTWDMQLDGIAHEIEKMEEYLFMTTETSPASFGLERDGSQVESARALRFKAHRTVNKVNDQREAFDGALRDVFRIAQKLENTEPGVEYQRGPIIITWPDPIIEDQDAEIQNYVARKGVGLVSRRRAVQDLDDLTDEQADAEVQEILQDEVDEAAAAGFRAEPAAALPEAAGAAPVGEVPEMAEAPAAAV